MFKAVIFDLDGVLVDTAKYHFICWKRLANSFGIDFDEAFNQSLKGVSRMDSLNRILEKGGVEKTDAEKDLLAEQKNTWYMECLEQLSHDELFEGSEETLRMLRQNGFKTALGSASKSGHFVLTKLGIDQLFDAIVDGNDVTNSKPNPEVFLTGASRLSVEASECAVLEDAPAGIQAAKAGGMLAIGVGPEVLEGDYHLEDLKNPSALIELLKHGQVPQS